MPTTVRQPRKQRIRPETRTARANACFLCGSASDHIVWREPPYEGRKCDCGMLYTNPLPSPGAVDFTVDLHPDEFYADSAAFKADWVAKHCPPGRLLEVGCGNGFFLAAAKERGYDVQGMEPHSARADRVERDFQVPVERSLLEASTIPDRSFDVVYHCDLLAHFPDPPAALERMRRMLRPGGVLCVEVGILGGISPVWYCLIRRLGLGEHLWLYSDDSLERLWQRGGLKVEFGQYFGLAPYVILGRAAAVVKRLGVGFLTSAQPLGMFPAPESAVRWHHRVQNFLRYRVGAVAPNIGPQTILLVLRPEN